MADYCVEGCHYTACFNMLFIICVLGILTEGLMTGCASKCLINSLVQGLLFHPIAMKH